MDLGHLLASPYVKPELSFDMGNEVDIVHQELSPDLTQSPFGGGHEDASPYQQFYSEYGQQCGDAHRAQGSDPIMAALGMEHDLGMETAWDVITGDQQQQGDQWSTWAPLSPQGTTPQGSPAAPCMGMDEGESEDESLGTAAMPALGPRSPPCVTGNGVVRPHTMQHHRQVMNELRTTTPRHRDSFRDEEKEEEEADEGCGGGGNVSRSQQRSAGGETTPAPVIDVASFWDLTDEQLATIDFKELTRLMKDAGLSEAQISESKAKRRRLKNRLSARVCSNKKREKCTELTGTNLQLQQRIKELERENKKLRKETDSLTGLNHQLSKAASDASQETLQLRTHVQHLSQLLAQAGLLSSVDGAAFAA